MQKKGKHMSEPIKTPIQSINEKIQAQLSKQPQKKKIPVSGKEYIGTGVSGIDELFEQGMPRGSSILIVGGPGSGKTIFCLQSLYEAAKAGERVLYITMEETPERLKKHMADF